MGKAYKLESKQRVLYGQKFTRHGVMLTYSQGTQIGKDRIRYVLRAGRKGTGRIVAKATCLFLCSDQERAYAEMRLKAGDISRSLGAVE